MIGQNLGHYRIVEKIGAGGMGEVYRAHDEHLERDVAIKVLPPGTLADESARKRFRKEALALSKLNHPNIATIFDFDTQGGVDFLVMELVVGESLSEKLPGRPLPEKEVLRIGAQLAEGLAAAHEQNVIHRDLKPGNLRLTPDGRLKILDFGLAKLIQPFSLSAPTASVTGTGIVAGTLPYMAPEQLRGEKADARSDIYAAGVVLYEMATGRRPFEQKLGSALAAAIVHEPPPPPHQFSPQLSSRLQDTILKCLEKEPENRYQSAKELLVDLRRLATPTAGVPPRREPRGYGARGFRWAALGLGAAVALAAVLVGLNVGGVRERLFGTAPPKIESLAVLPLENLSRDPEQDYFADGMTEALIAELSKISALKVISRTSVMQYKGAKKPMPEIARELDVDGVIEGSVQREGDQVRISVQLIHGPTDKHLWADSYQREMRGILALQSDVARDIARQIEVTLTPLETTRLAAARPVNPEAYQLYLKGRFHWNKRNEEELKKGREYFEQAIEADPTYALAYAGLADSYNVLADYTALAPEEAIPKARAAALRALEMDETLAQAHASLGLVKETYEWDWAGAEREFKRALELDPSYASAHQWFALYLSSMGRFEEAFKEITRAQELDPLALIMHRAAGVVFNSAREYDAEIEQYQKALAVNADFVPAHIGLVQPYVEQGKFEEAIAETQTLRKLTGDFPVSLSRQAYAYARAGRKREALNLLNELKQQSKRRYVSSLSFAAIYVALGERAQALAWMERAYTERSPGMYRLKVDPIWDPLRSDPRFQDLLRRMNFPEN